MKKFLVVLLIAVLTVSSAFAALTGTVTTTAKYDLDAKNFDIHTVGEIKGSYKLPFAALFAGASDEGKTANEGSFPYAVAEATLTVTAGKVTNDGWVFDGTSTKDAHGNVVIVNETEKKEYPAVSATYPKWGKEKGITFTDGSASSVKATVKLTKAEIIGEEWKLDFLTGPSVANYSKKDFATTAIIGADSTDCGAKAEKSGYKFDSIAGKIAEKEGLTFTWNKYGSVAVAANANEKEADSYFLITLESVDYALTDELKGQAAVSFDKNGESKLATYLSGKLAYANLVPGKLTANFAIDSKIAKDGGIELNGDFAYDNDFITGEAYYASVARNFDYKCTDPKAPATTGYKHEYDTETTEFANNFTYFKATVDGRTKYPAFVPVLTVEGYSHAGNADKAKQDMVADWKLTSTYTKDAKAYATAEIGMTDTLKNKAAQTLFGSVATTVTNYQTFENIGKLTFKIGAENFLDIDDAKAEMEEFIADKTGAVKTAKESGFYFNASAEDFVVKGLGFIFSAADLIKEKGQVFALDVTYADEKEVVKATAGFATGLKNSVFAGNSSAIYGDVNYKFNEELTGYVGAFGKVGTANWERYYVGADYVKTYEDEKTNSLSARLDIYHKNGADAEVGLYAKAASTKIVNGAELALTYGANAAGIGALEKDTYFGNLTTKAVENPITATCTIKF